MLREPNFPRSIMSIRQTAIRAFVLLVTGATLSGCVVDAFNAMFPPPKVPLIAEDCRLITIGSVANVEIRPSKIAWPFVFHGHLAVSIERITAVDYVAVVLPNGQTADERIANLSIGPMKTGQLAQCDRRAVSPGSIVRCDHPIPGTALAVWLRMANDDGRPLGRYLAETSHFVPYVLSEVLNCKSRVGQNG